MRLLGAELRRLTHRRAILWLFIALVILCAGFSVLVWYTTRPPRADPVTLQGYLVGIGGDVIGTGIATGEAACIAGLLALLMGAMFVGGEFASGSIATWLTFEPRRTRVYVTKLVAVAIGAIVFSIVDEAILTAGTWLALRINNADTTVPSDFWLRTYAPRVGWVALLVVAGGVAGAGLTFALRHTAAVIGLIAGYGVIAEGILPNFLDTAQPYLLVNNIFAFADGKLVYSLRNCSTDASGYNCQWIDHTLTRPHAAIELGAILLVSVVAGWAVFRRAEVK